MRAWRVLRRLTWSQRWTVVLAAFLLPVFGFLLRFGVLPKLWAREAGAGTQSLERARHTAHAVDLVAHLLHCSCLTRSLVLHWILTRRDIGAVLRIGVRHEGTLLKAHAWVECAGVPVNDSAESALAFTPLVRV